MLLYVYAVPRQQVRHECNEAERALYLGWRGERDHAVVALYAYHARLSDYLEHVVRVIVVHHHRDGVVRVDDRELARPVVNPFELHEVPVARAYVNHRNPAPYARLRPGEQLAQLGRGLVRSLARGIAHHRGLYRHEARARHVLLPDHLSHGARVRYAHHDRP